MVDALVDGIAVVVHFILSASDAFRDNCLCFVSEEAVNCLIRVRNEVESVNLKIIEAINGAGQWDNVFLEAVVR